jgi:exonuclease VII small subunit
MITGNWGTVHGLFYPDGTVRDPSIVAALLGFFRNRGANVVEEIPDRENHVTEAVENNKKWLADANPDWRVGLDLAETCANLLEAAQLVPMHDLPTRQVELLRTGHQDMLALHVMLEKFTTTLEPFQLPPGDPRRSRPPGFIK